MLSHRKEALMRKVHWSTGQINSNLPAFDSIKTLECWKYEGIGTAIRDENYRSSTLAHLQHDKNKVSGSIERKVDDWLSQANTFSTPSPPQNAGKLRGGLRIVFCDRRGWRPSMSLSEATFRSIEKAFDLHSTTIHSFLLTNGSFATFSSKDPSTNAVETIQIVIKAPQKTEITNCLISLTYNVKTCWTDAFICGAGMTAPRQKYDFLYGIQEEQFFGALLSDPRYWSNPMVLACSLLTMCTERIETRIFVTDSVVVDLENQLGVTYAGGAGLPNQRDKWPEDIDVRTTMKELHSVLPQIVFVRSFCLWLCKYSTFLLELEARLSKDLAATRSTPYFGNLNDTLLSLQSAVENLSNGFDVLRERTNSQINLLFSIISQQESLINRRGNSLNLAIARSTKQDSISMSTFTFITAIFLPGTYIASLFSMSMFNWGTGGGDSSSGSAAYVSNKFWLYWAVTVPLTMVALAGWYFWFIYANKKWERSLRGVM